MSSIGERNVCPVCFFTSTFILKGKVVGTGVTGVRKGSLLVSAVLLPMKVPFRSSPI